MVENERPAAGGTADRPVFVPQQRDDNTESTHMAQRRRLPNRRYAETLTVEWRGRPINVSVGYALDGRPLEVFARASRPDSDLDVVVDDAAVLVSRALQYADRLDQIRGGIGRLPLGEPASVIGVIIDAAMHLVGAR